jgi:hypothetical protein
LNKPLVLELLEKPSSSTTTSVSSLQQLELQRRASTVAGFTAFNAPVLIVDFSAEVAPKARR